MAKKKLGQYEADERAMVQELIRRRSMLMAAAEGITQTALQDRLVTEYWENNYAGGPLQEVIDRQLNGS
jgi:hypothetical protein